MIFVPRFGEAWTACGGWRGWKHSALLVDSGPDDLNDSDNIDEYPNIKRDMFTLSSSEWLVYHLFSQQHYEHYEKAARRTFLRATMVYERNTLATRGMTSCWNSHALGIGGASVPLT